MYKLITSINDVWDSPKTYADKVFLLIKENDNRIINQFLFNGKTELISLGITASDFYFFNKVMMTCQIGRTIQFWNLSDFSLAKSISDYEATRIDTSQHYVFLRNFKENGTIDILNISSFENNLRLGVNGSNFLMHNDLIFYCEFTGYPFVKNLHCFNIKRGTVVWKININEIPDLNTIESDEQYFSRFQYAYENILVIRIGNRFHIGLDINTGEQKWRNNDLKYAQLQDGKLYSIGTEFFCVVDALTGKTEILKDCRAEFEANHQMTSSSAFTIDKDFLYLKAYRGIVGVFSIEKQSLVWSYNLNTTEMKIQFGANEKPVIAGNKLMILDLNNTLHVFEKEA